MVAWLAFVFIVSLCLLFHFVSPSLVVSLLCVAFSFGTLLAPAMHALGCRLARPVLAGCAAQSGPCWLQFLFSDSCWIFLVVCLPFGVLGLAEGAR